MEFIVSSRALRRNKFRGWLIYICTVAALKGFVNVTCVFIVLDPVTLSDRIENESAITLANMFKDIEDFCGIMRVFHQYYNERIC
jgi:hypothetical protein